MKVYEALDGIRKRDIVLPEFQREYVWTKDQAKQLMVSLIREYPVGSLLLWKTDNPPELKNIDNLPEKLGSISVLLDGQQRLTTLHMLMTDSIPSYYRSEDIKNDPRGLHYNLETGDFQYYQASKMKDDPAWVKVTECFTKDDINAFNIAENKGLEGEVKFSYANQLNKNLTKLTNITKASLPEEIVPSSADLTDAIDIFDRVNSQGTKLTDAELALTHVTAKWPQARRIFKDKIEYCENRNFNFTLTFMTRALTVAVTRRALFPTIHEKERTALEAGWKALDKVLDYLMTFLPQKAYIHSTDDLNTSNALIPLVAYLAYNQGRFPSDESIKHAINWLYSALMWARYTSQTDQRLETDVSLIAKEELPWETLRSQIVDQRGRTKVEPSDFAGRGAQSPFYRAVFILAKAHEAVDWFNGLPLGQTHGKAYGIHSHHIFPQSVLYKNGYNPDDYTHRQLVNEIANRAFLTADSNIRLSDKSPEKYLPKIEDKYPGALPSQFVPMDPVLWKVENYQDFLVARRELLARKLNEYMASLIEEPEQTHHRPITELISLGESYSLEFKSTLQWDMYQNKQNKALRFAIVKTVAAFMNSEGGTLVIGVEDDGNVIGLENDLKILNNSTDKYIRTLASAINDNIGGHSAHLYKIRIEKVNGESVCVVDVERSSEPVFANSSKSSKEFYVRVGNTTRAFNAEDTHRYVESHWQ